MSQRAFYLKQLGISSWQLRADVAVYATSVADSTLSDSTSVDAGSESELVSTSAPTPVVDVTLTTPAVDTSISDANTSDANTPDTYTSTIPSEVSSNVIEPIQDESVAVEPVMLESVEVESTRDHKTPNSDDSAMASLAAPVTNAQTQSFNDVAPSVLNADSLASNETFEATKPDENHASTDTLATVDLSRLALEPLQQHVQACSLCELSAHRQQVVWGSGNSAARVMIVSDAPNADEDAANAPFQGEAGSLFDKMLSALGLNRDECFITHVVKCHPPERHPHVSEVVCCEPYLMRQIELIQPTVILSLGLLAAQHFLPKVKKMAEARTQSTQIMGIPVVMSYHPAYLLRRPLEKRKSWDDLLRLNTLLLSATNP